MKDCLHKILIKNKLRGIKYLFLLLCFIIIPFVLNKYSFQPTQLAEIAFEKPKEETPSSEIQEKPIAVQKKTVTIEPQIVTPPKEPDFINLPIEPGPLDFSMILPAIDTLSILAEMLELRVDARDTYQAHKFYIPPVEYKLKPKDLILPASLITIGAIASHTDKFRDIIPGMRNNPQDKLTPFDDVAQLVVSPSLFIFDIIGEEKHHFIDQFFLMGISYGITVLPVRIIKNNYYAPRPYGGNHSFPSGHTATAFVGAHMIYKEFKDTNPWIAYSGYAMASVVAGARVVNNKHWVCDVMAGAGIAILATELAYLIYFPVRNLITNGINDLVGKYIILSPAIHPEGLSLNLSVSF